MRYGAQVTTKLFKRLFIREAGVSFTQGIVLGEDTIFCTESFARAESVTLFGKCYYYYRMFRPSSTMASYFSLRDVYKRQVKDYKNGLEIFPSSMVAAMMGLKDEYPFFEAEEAAKAAIDAGDYFK